MRFLSLHSFVVEATLVLLVPHSAVASPAETALAVVDAGIQAAEDTPFVRQGYEFLPGEFVYFTFTVSGYEAEKKGESKSVNLEYRAALQDSKAVPLTPPEAGSIQDELHPQDKDWLPKRRLSFQLPSYLNRGTFTLQLTVRDVASKTEIVKTFSFQVGGRNLKPSETLDVQDFHFYRGEGDAEPLEVVAYRPGDTVWARFDMVGFKTDLKHAYKVDYGLTVYRPDGTILFTAPKAAEQSAADFYPAQFIPGVLSLTTTPDLAHAEYTILLTVRDQVGKQTFEHRYSFHLE
jgi:hypothetical protein